MSRLASAMLFAVVGMVSACAGIASENAGDKDNQGVAGIGNGASGIVIPPPETASRACVQACSLNYNSSLVECGVHDLIKEQTDCINRSAAAYNACNLGCPPQNSGAKD